MGRATQRSLDILELIANEQKGMPHAEIARRLNIPKSTLTDLLRDLVARNYLELDNAGCYLIGPGTLSISRAYLNRVDIVNRSGLILSQLCEHVDETAAITLRQGIEMVVVAQARPHGPLAAVMAPGDRGPMIATAGGKAILAFSPDDEIARVYKETRNAGYKIRKLLSESALREQLKAVRAGEPAYSRDEWIEGVTSLSFPIFDDRAVVASLTVPAATTRLAGRRMKTVATAVKRAANELTMRMGGRPL